MTIRWKQVILSLVTGLLLGAAVVSWIQRDGALRPGWEGHHRRPRMMEHLRGRLDLTPDQEGRISEILEEKRKRIQALNGEVRPRFQEIRRSTRDEIGKILTPDQLKRFDEMEIKRNAGGKRRRAPR